MLKHYLSLREPKEKGADHLLEEIDSKSFYDLFDRHLGNSWCEQIHPEYNRSRRQGWDY